MYSVLNIREVDYVYINFNQSDSGICARNGTASGTRYFIR
jgi:hypothetical protein